MEFEDHFQNFVFLMAADNNIKNFTATDIEKYHQGLLSAKEKHDLEKAALDDPFLADAIEGYSIEGINTISDLADLKKRLSERVEDAKVVPLRSGRKTFSPFLRAAAMIIVLVGAGLLVYQFAFNKKGKEVAQARSEKNVPANPASSDTGSINNTVGNKTSGSATTKDDSKKIITSPAGPVNDITKGEQKPGNISSETAGTKADETTSTVKGELKPVTTSDAPVVNVPAGQKDGVIATEKSLEKATDRELSREEAKSKAPVAKKQAADKDVTRGFTDNETDDSKKRKAVAASQGAGNQDGYYRNQAMNTFRGRVTDPSNTGLPFANVTNTRDNVGTYTDANGNFTLTSADSVLDVQIRSIGYEYNNTQLRNDVATNRVVMQEDQKKLSEVVVSTQKPNAATRSKDGNRQLTEPEPKDGWDKYDSYLANNLNMPDDFKERKQNETNSVQVSFEVDKNGEPVNIRVEKSLCPSCDKEAIRLVKDGPKWKRNAGKKGRTTVTINF